MTAPTLAWAPLGRSTKLFAYLAAAALTAALGAALMAVSAPFDDASPAVAIALPLAPVLALAVIARPLVGVLGVFATLPLGSVGAPVGPVTLQAVEVAVLILGALLVLRRLAMGETPLPWSPLFAFPLALIAWTLVALYSAIDETLAVKQLAALTGGVVFASVVLASCKSMVDVRRVLGVLTAVAALVSILALSSGARFESQFSGALVAGRLQGAFDHPNQLGSFCALAGAIALALVVGARTRRARVASGAALALMAAALALTLSRGAWIAMAVAAVFLFIVLPGARRILFVFGIPLAILGVVIWSAEPDRPELKVVGERARALTVLSPYDGRYDIWAEAVREIKDDPLTGQGPGSFPVASVRAASEASSVTPRHAHNILLNWGAETGVPAAVIVVAFAVALGFATRTASRGAKARGDPGDRAIVLGLAAALLSVAGQGTVDYTLSNSVLHILVWGLIGCLLVAVREGSAPRVKRPSAAS